MLTTAWRYIFFFRPASATTTTDNGRDVETVAMAVVVVVVMVGEAKHLECEKYRWPLSERRILIVNNVDGDNDGDKFVQNGYPIYTDTHTQWHTHRNVSRTISPIRSVCKWFWLDFPLCFRNHRHIDDVPHYVDVCGVLCVCGSVPNGQIDMTCEFDNWTRERKMSCNFYTRR